MPAPPFLTQHRDDAGGRAAESKQDMESDDGQKERGRGRNCDTNYSLAIRHLLCPCRSVMQLVGDFPDCHRFDHVLHQIHGCDPSPFEDRFPTKIINYS
jgi:hypothetical protein